MIQLGELVMILDWHRQGMSVSAIARQSGLDRKTVRKYIQRGLEAPAYGPRKPRQTVIDPFTGYLRERVSAFPGLTGSRLFREIKEHGYAGGYTAVTDFLREIRPTPSSSFEVRFETAPGLQAQVDFAQFQVVFTDEPTTPRIVWLFSLVLGYSRLIWARFVLHQDLATVLRCHVAAFEALGGVPHEVLYDRMKTVVTGEAGSGGIIYNRALIDLARHFGFHPKACRPYRAKTKGKVERPFRYIREDFFLARSFQQSRGPEPAAAALAFHRGQPARSCHHVPRCHGGLCRGASLLAASTAGPLPVRLAAGAADLARRHGQCRRQLLQRARCHPPARGRGAHSGRRDPHLRGGRVDWRPSRSRGPPPAPGRAGSPQEPSRAATA